MATLHGKERRDYVKGMFARVASRYDQANRWLSMGQNARWRDEVLKLASLPGGGRLLDIGTGTGDLAIHAALQDRSAQIIGADFSPEMLAIGRNQSRAKSIAWVIADALELPFATGYFECVVSGYLLRNVIDIKAALAEQYRVLKRGGRMVCLETTRLPDDFRHLPARLFERYFMPLIGQLVAGNRQAYEYLPKSTEKFLSTEELAGLIGEIGFIDIHYRVLMAGTMAIHWGVK